MAERKLVVRPPGGFEGDWRQNDQGGWELSRRRTLPFPELESGWTCDHRRMRYCCRKPCGHLVCPCGLAWDEGACR